MNKIISNDWDLKIFGGLSKNQIRQLAKGVFNNDYLIFVTLCDCETINDEILIFTIELNNANIKYLDNIMGDNYAEQLSSNSNTHEFIFKNYKTNNEVIDLHEYEPSKISKGTFSNITHVYSIIEAKLKH